jgi:putative restriction endonuclease
MVNGGGSCEIEAAHVKAVEDHGPDSIRNGLAMSRTVHWAFDHGILALEDDGRILIAKRLIPQAVAQMLNRDGYALLPDDKVVKPHPLFLRFHREHRFKG